MANHRAAYHDWINRRDLNFQQYMPLGSDDTKSRRANDAIFRLFCSGLKTHRDVWVYNSSKEVLRKNMERTITFYNQLIDENHPTNMLKKNPTKMKWSHSIQEAFQQKRCATYKESNIYTAVYRPFFKQWLYFDRMFNDAVSRIPSFFPTADTENLVICVTGKGSKKPFSVFMTNTVPDLEVVSKGQCFPRYSYEELEDRSLFSDMRQWRRVDNILDETLEKFCRHYKDDTITKDDIFYYVYGVLHSVEYRECYGNNLSRELPRIPLSSDWRVFVRLVVI